MRVMRHVGIVTALVLCMSASAEEPMIETVAGGGPDDVPGACATIGDSRCAAIGGHEALTFDAAGNLYFASILQHRVFKFDLSGQLTVVAGNGTVGFGGDGGPAVDAYLDEPLGVAVDSSGNVYISDLNNKRIRRVDGATGIITTVVGDGVSGSGGDGGPAVDARVKYPLGLVVDSSDNLFITDFYTHSIRRVDAVTGIITMVAGVGTAGFSGDDGPATAAHLANPRAVAIDGADNLFIADTYNRRVRRVDAVTGTITTVAGTGGCPTTGDGGPATSAQTCAPYGVAVDHSGNFFIAISSNHRIRRVDGATGIINAWAGGHGRGCVGDGGLGTNARVFFTRGLAVDAAGDLFLTGGNCMRIRKVDGLTGIIDKAVGNGFAGYGGDMGSALQTGLRSPRGVASDAAGNLYIADTGNATIRRLDAATGIITTLAGAGTHGYTGDDGPATSAKLYHPSGIARDAAGNLYIADMYNNRIRHVDAATGVISTIAGNGLRGFTGDGGSAISAKLNRPTGVAVDSVNNVYIADHLNNRIRRVSDGIITTVAGTGTEGFAGDGGPAANAQFRELWGVSVDADDNLLIADTKNHRVRFVDMETGIISTVAGNGLASSTGDGGPATSAKINSPHQVALDAGGNMFIAETGVNKIRRVNATTGIITTYAGTGKPGGFSGDGGPASAAQLRQPYSVAVDANGNLYIADMSNSRIRKVSGNTPPVADAGPDQTVECQGDGQVTVTLDASASHDPNGDPLVYTWTGPFEAIGGSDPVATVTLDLGAYTIELEVEDDNGGMGTDTVVITVQDTTPPDLTCPEATTVECDGAGNASELSDWLSDVYTSDSCGGVSLIDDFVSLGDGCGQTGSAVVTWTAEDDATLTNTCSSDFSITDTLAPALVVDATPIAGRDADCSWEEPVALPQATASDACGAVSLSHDAPGTFPAGQTTWVNYQATDDCGNSAFESLEVTVEYGADIFVTAERHTVGSGANPGSTKEPLVGIEICAYDKSEGSCARVECGGISHHHYECIALGDGTAGPCDPVNCCTTDDAGGCTINLPPGDYVVISADATKTVLPDPLGVSASDLQCGELMQKHLQQIVKANGNRPRN